MLPPEALGAEGLERAWSSAVLSSPRVKPGCVGPPGRQGPCQAVMTEAVHICGLQSSTALTPAQHMRFLSPQNVATQLGS